jgi:hypothetical protein
VLTVAVCVEVPEDYKVNLDNLFIENESLGLMDLRGSSFKVLEFETLDVEESNGSGKS